MLTIVLSLLTAACYGTADFCGGLATRASRVTSVLFTSHGASLAVLLAALWIVPTAHPTRADWLLSLVGGVAAFIGLLALYRALGGGNMAIVSAVSAVLSALVPALVGVATGERLAPLGWCGIALGLVATVLVSAGGGASAAGRDSLGRTVLLSVIAGLGIVAMLAVTSRCSSGAGLVAVTVMRSLSVGVLAVVLFGGRLHSGRRAAAGGRPGLLPSRPWLAALAGCLDVLGTVLFLRASLAGEVAVAAVLAAQYPLVTASMARGLLGERLTRLQLVGFAATLVAVALLALGR